MTRIPVAVQLYTLRDELEKDFKGTIEKVAELGYEGVEFAGYGGYSAQEVRELLEQVGLQVAASHISLEQLEENLEEVISFEKELGNTAIVCPYLAPERQTEEGYKQLISVLNHAERRCAEEGIRLYYHHHDFGLKELPNGKSALETILDETNVGVEFDVYWLTKAGGNPVEWMKKYQNRARLIHLKDMTTDDKQLFAPLGTGGVNLTAILSQGDNMDVKWWIIEQDQCEGPALDSVKQSLGYYLQHA
ncbi:sugar phosphate isomerase/epimerase family protein [Priestia flexa]|uniref:sugar phosphate isomerase/epimerase family protein n=1 Tax=Priestia flexa TaxID=86664 RepID=UPI0024900E5F|nr:sugar phosphate isomerase/epimerase [Priestia flexa]